MRNAAVVVSLAAILSACASAPVAEAPLPEPAPLYAGVERPATASLWNQAPESLFGNRRARYVGDILTVIVEIDEEAEIGNEMDRSRSVSQNFGVRALFGLPSAAQVALPQNASLDPGVDFDRDTSVSGSGSLKREDRVTLRLAARVTEALPNGYLVIDGEQQVRVNHEMRILRASGIIRPEDISRGNTITHEKIADARIGYVGRGAIERTTAPRIGNRLLDVVVPF